MCDFDVSLRALLFWTGIGQFVLVAGSLLIPKVLGWRDELRRLRPLTRRVFWTYACYILGTNLAFALVSTLIPAALLDSSPLAVAVTCFMAAYWCTRLVIQFACLRRVPFPLSPTLRAAEAMLVLAFVWFTCAYGLAVWHNLNGSGR
jgi:hypothetical protein